MKMEMFRNNYSVNPLLYLSAKLQSKRNYYRYELFVSCNNRERLLRLLGQLGYTAVRNIVWNCASLQHSGP